MILLLSVTSGHQARGLIRKIVSNPDSWSAWEEGRLPKPDYLQVTGMYEIIGNWDLAVFVRARTNSPKILIRQLRREILREANFRTFPPVHESGGRFGRFQGIDTMIEMPSLDPRDSASFQRTTCDGSAEYERLGRTRSFIVMDVADEEEGRVRIDDLVVRMHRAVSKDPEAASVERVYKNSSQLVLELMSVRPGATDITRFNRLIEPSLAEHAVLKYTLLCYEYDEEPCGWGSPPSLER